MNVRLSPELHDHLVFIAAREHRSLQRQIVQMLWEALERRGILPSPTERRTDPERS